tara:strand:- start:418 stop:1110 length:693 start_codon:yes stop_codon:yes gene_type:complete
MGGPTILMSDGDEANNIRGFAIQAFERCSLSRLDLDMNPVSPVGEKYTITAVTNASNELTIAAAAIEKLLVGDKVLLNWGGVDMPQGTIQDTQGRATEFKDKSVYFIQAIDTASNEIKLEETKGAGAITLADDGTLYGKDTWIAKVSDQDFSYGTFKRNASANPRTHEIIGNVDGRIFKTYDDSGLQVNMFDTTGGTPIGNVVIPAGVTIYLPITDVTVTEGACIIYTRK